MSINKSLLTLGRVISALSKQYQNGKKTFIPYRESVLTWYVLGMLSETLVFSSIHEAPLPILFPCLSNDLLKEEISLLHQIKIQQVFVF